VAFVVLGLIELLVVLPICFLGLRDGQVARPATLEERQVQAEARTKAFKAAVGGPIFRSLILAFFLLGLVNTALITQQIPLLIDNGLTLQKAAFVQSMFGVFVLVGRLLAGYLLDRMFAPVLVIVAALGAAIACLMYSAGVPAVLVYVPPALIGLVVGAEFNVLGYMIKRYFGMAAFGKIYAVIFSVFQLGAAFGAAVFAFAHDATGSYRVSLYAAAAALVLASVAFAMLPKYQRPASE
jgi:predicted MFS family arabinose efflux permease